MAAGSIHDLAGIFVEKPNPGADQRDVGMLLEEGHLLGEPLGMADVVGVHHRDEVVGFREQAREPEVLCPGDAEIFVRPDDFDAVARRAEEFGQRQTAAIASKSNGSALRRRLSSARWIVFSAL